MGYLEWLGKNEANSCVLGSPKGIEKSYELNKGIPRAHNFPPDVSFGFDPDHPKNIALTDNLMNTDGLVVVSKNLKEFLGSKNLVNVEYLPVTILNHKNKVASRDYFIVHPIFPQDCLDAAKSGCAYSDVAPDEIMFLEMLAIDESRIDPKVQLFRVKNYYRPILIKDDLANEIAKKGFKGVQFPELSLHGA
jgi:hypothetical protein